MYQSEFIFYVTLVMYYFFSYDGFFAELASFVSEQVGQSSLSVSTNILKPTVANFLLG